MRILLSGLEQAVLAHPLLGLWDELVARADCQLTGGHMLSRKTVRPQDLVHPAIYKQPSTA